MLLDRLQRLNAGAREHGGDRSMADLPAELLQDESFQIGFVIDDKDRCSHLALSEMACRVNLRRSVMMNSVKISGSVATSILPPCCFTTMSWLIDKPSPVPSPAGLVVKNGLNICSFTSRGMPVPLSRIRISTLLPRFLVAALSVGSKFCSPDSLPLVAA